MNAYRKLTCLCKYNKFCVSFGSLSNAFCYDNRFMACSFVALVVAINSHYVRYGQRMETISITATTDGCIRV